MSDLEHEQYDGFGQGGGIPAICRAARPETDAPASLPELRAEVTQLREDLDATREVVGELRELAGQQVMTLTLAELAARASRSPSAMARDLA